MEDLRLAVLDILEPLYHRNISNLQATLEEQFSAQLDILVSLRYTVSKVVGLGSGSRLVTKRVSRESRGVKKGEATGILSGSVGGIAD